MRQPGRRVLPANVAGLGLIRAAVDQPDGSSHVILQGLARIELQETVHRRPYWAYRYRLLDSQYKDAVSIDRLTGKILKLVSSQLRPGQTIHLSINHASKAMSSAEEATSQPGVELTADVDNPEQIADLISWTLLSDPRKRQTLLETLDVETRLRRLIQFLLAEVRESSQRSPNNP
jgi:ATP-dependent Lon protease